MSSSQSNIREELNRFRQIKRSHGLLSINVKPNPELYYQTQNTNSSTDDSQSFPLGACSFSRQQSSPIFIANHHSSSSPSNCAIITTTNETNASLATPTPRTQRRLPIQPNNSQQQHHHQYQEPLTNHIQHHSPFSNSAIHHILSPTTASRLELVKRLNTDLPLNNEDNRLISEGTLFTDEDKENDSSAQNTTVPYDANPLFPSFNNASTAKSNNRYSSLDHCNLSRNTLFATDKSCDFIDQNSQQPHQYQKQQQQQYSQQINSSILQNHNNQSISHYNKDASRFSMDGSFIVYEDANDSISHLQSQIEVPAKPKISSSLSNPNINAKSNSYSFNNPTAAAAAAAAAAATIPSESPDQACLSKNPTPAPTEQNSAQQPQNIMKPPRNMTTIKTELLNESMSQPTFNLYRQNSSTSNSYAATTTTNQITTPSNSSSHPPLFSSTNKYIAKQNEQQETLPVIRKLDHPYDEEEYRAQIEMLTREKDEKDEQIHSLQAEIFQLKRELKLQIEQSTRETNSLRTQLDNQNHLKLQFEHLLSVNEKLSEKNEFLLEIQQNNCDNTNPSSKTTTTKTIPQTKDFTTTPSPIIETRFPQKPATSITPRSKPLDFHQVIFTNLSANSQLHQQKQLQYPHNINQSTKSKTPSDRNDRKNQQTQISKHSAPPKPDRTKPADDLMNNTTKQVSMFAQFDTSSGRCYHTSRIQRNNLQDSRMNSTETFRRSTSPLNQQNQSILFQQPPPEQNKHFFINPKVNSQQQQQQHPGSIEFTSNNPSTNRYRNFSAQSARSFVSQTEPNESLFHV